MAVPVAGAESFDALSAPQREQWRSLLFFEPGAHASTITDQDFFLSEAGRTDPRQEFTALLDAYHQPWPEDPNDHPRCRFPGRYHWLGRNLAAHYATMPTQCQKLNAWPVLHTATRVSVVYVTGYMGNPASAFGHTFLKIDTGERDDLMDQSVNYGAMVPPEEPMATYVVKGLSGGYTASYSDRYFYTQDMTYSNTELRDMWKYPLRLDDTQRQQLLLTIWETLGRKQVYYFLNRNCAYALAKLIESSTGGPIVGSANVWYAPVEMIHDLQRTPVDPAHPDDAPSLLGDPVFIPSAERKLRQVFARLSPQAREQAIAILAAEPATLAHQLHDIPDPADRLAIADVVVEGYQYGYVKQQPEVSPALLEGRRQALVARMQMPGSPPRAQPDVPPTSPSTSDRPSRVGVGLAYREGRDTPYAQIHLSAFSQESSGTNTLGGSELTFGDAVLDTLDDRLRIQSIDYLRVRKLQPMPLPLDGFDALSWKTRVASEQSTDDREGSTRHLASFHVGKTLGMFESGATLTPYLGAVLSSGDRILSFAPSIDVRLPLDQVTLFAEMDWGLKESTNRYAFSTKATLQYAVSPQWEVGFHHTTRTETIDAITLTARF